MIVGFPCRQFVSAGRYQSLAFRRVQGEGCCFEQSAENKGFVGMAKTGFDDKASKFDLVSRIVPAFRRFVVRCCFQQSQQPPLHEISG